MTKRGRRPTHDLSQVSCPNPDCSDYGEVGRSSIVSNGTYTTKSGIGQRFKCKTCGCSFCNRSGTIFHGLRSSEEKVISALKLLAKGISVRKAAEIMEMKPDTLRHWLALMATQSDAVNRRLAREIGMAESELEALWDFVKQDALRERAILWRKKCGWKKGWDATS